MPAEDRPASPAAADRTGGGAASAAAAGSAWPAANLLRHETSPYLLQHADNPVHWRPWGEAAFAEARARGVPVLLSVGYAACHWCHVMAHESFEDPATAAVMNRLYVNIKLDREERPDLDQIYQHALALLGQQGGWPLTMFLTPKGEPFWGGTYFPPAPRWGRPGFAQVLENIAAVYAGEPDKIAQNVAALTEALAELGVSKPGSFIGPAELDAGARALLRGVDPRHGGLQGAPKFPQPALFAFLWQQARRTGQDAYAAAVTLTLDRMSQGGIYDHLGGGYARYSTDEVWLVPHFEKMLYDNAQLLELLASAWAATKSPLYAQRAAETVDWLAREMMGPANEAGDAAFAAALDADSEGEEGKFYVWTEAEIDALLGADAGRFKTAYDATALGNWEGHVILNRSHAAAWAGEAEEAFLAACRARLLAAREQRVRPQRDDKILADWNGLMVAALARAGATFARPDWTLLARRAFAFIAAELDAGAEPAATQAAVPARRLYHAWAAGRARHAGLLEDHAAMARAAIALHEVTGEGAYLAQAQGWVAAAEALFGDGDGSFFMAAADARDVLVRSKSAHDNAAPSGNGL
ncbi:MAG: thioredoxin domain-containing protein, partial [Alphaproteobacteria bacterium]|nr:thioredoxin domain-containing protein [Alphaproteobacteria bacterium]